MAMQLLRPDTDFGEKETGKQYAGREEGVKKLLK